MHPENHPTRPEPRGVGSEELSVGASVWLPLDRLQGVIDALRADGMRVVGPQVAEGAVVYRDLERTSDLPLGWIDEQDGGRYRLTQQAEAGVFDHVVGPHSLKNFLFPSRDTIGRFLREDGTWKQLEDLPPEPPLAVLGVRACDLAGLAIQDRVFLGGEAVDPHYRRRRESLFLVAVNCRRAAATCFCHSTGCGPAVTGGFDLALTEFSGRFLCDIGSLRGAEMLAKAAAGSPLDRCTADEVQRARQQSAALEQAMHARREVPGEPRPRSMEMEGLRDLLFNNLEHARWDDVASRCLSCTNCTLVCPTCFCASVTEVADLSGDHVERERHWASCFTLDHARMHGESVRSSTASRYRQWLTHKLAGWIDQFGTSGCTGCGRCITWCPVGIDLTEEVAAIRDAPPPQEATP
jgi:sulfhydrogenase subunit beta (sulfur reductase)